ncbi:3-carboxy-cis,cis-muconate cycloisomerase [Oceaniglobus ichthyenteri]|uniref:3-carboxy-cis,cis-muconate cycloisomerase n=1 Tax=Oceaniglobus ichthyenteri TaxID=2136177 RepID=UPI000D35D9FB|nr:3-carboxy-cis,cis-muconate cycloisomerase [Oceaniglobus ichthyenteri]
MTNAFTASGLFGGLFSDTAIAAEFDAPAFTRRMIAFEAEWTRALGATGVVPADDMAAALDAIARFSGADLGQGSARDGIPVPALVAALKTGLSKGAASAVHTGATSQDVMDTAMVLTCLSVLDILVERLSDLIARLDGLFGRFGDRPMMARTRMQAALPATVALRVGAWRRPLVDHLARAETLRGDLAVVQIGGAIGTRDAPSGQGAACAEIVARALGLSLGPVWHTDRSRMIEFGHWLTLVAGSVGKIGQDIALMAQQGMDEIALSGGGGSSAMAHKQNPVAAEAMIALSRYVGGQQGVLAQAMIHEQERSGAAWALEWLTLPAMAEATGAALRHAQTVIPSIVRIGAPDPAP